VPKIEIIAGKLEKGPLATRAPAEISGEGYPQLTVVSNFIARAATKSTTWTEDWKPARPHLNAWRSREPLFPSLKTNCLHFNYVVLYTLTCWNAIKDNKSNWANKGQQQPSREKAQKEKGKWSAEVDGGYKSGYPLEITRKVSEINKRNHFFFVIYEWFSYKLCIKQKKLRAC